MRIRQVFLLSIALGAAVGAMAAMLSAAQQWSAFQAALGAQQATRLLVEALRLPETMNIERAFIAPRLADPAAATLAQLDPITRQARLVDFAMRETRHLAVFPADTAALNDLDAKLRDVREAALAAIARPQTERPMSAVDRYLQHMFAVQETAYALATVIQLRTSTSNPEVGQATRLALLSWDLRDWSGRQTTTLISYISRHLPMAGQQAEALAVFKGRIDQKWQAVLGYAAVVGSPDVLAAVEKVELGFWARGGEAYASHVVPNRGRTLDIDPDRFVISIRPILDSILPLRNAALDEALRRSDADIAMHRRRFLLALGLVLLTAGAAAGASRWFDIRVMRPTEKITTIILALANGDRDVRVPFQARTDELGQMAKAIEALRSHALQAELVARQMLALQLARAEEKSRLSLELTQSNEALAVLNHELASLAAMDALTGIANRRSFDLALAREWRRAQREATSLSLLLLDIDHFKSFNDRYGHPAGDTCLARVAAAIASVTRRSVDVTSRYGGEEFAVVLPTTPLAGAADVAEQVRSAVAALKILHPDNPCGVVTVSVGVSAIIPRPSERQEALLNSTDSALYAAKRAGRNQVAMAPGASFSGLTVGNSLVEQAG